MTSGYSGTPMADKLGIRAGSRVLLRRAPAGLALEPAADVVLHRRADAGRYDIIVLFCPDRATLHADFAVALERLSVAGGLWACWPKRASGVATDLTETGVRDHGLGIGVVDVKIAAIDTTWSGLKFVRRVVDRVVMDP
ncbi:MAG: DUF3052 domain-containing protein [Jatrophihabitantaceae bacterium]